MQRSLPLVVAVISALALSASCSRTTASPSETDAASSSAAQPSVQTLNITHDATTVGAEVRATASGLPAGKTVELTWKTVSGGWVIEDYYHFKGKKCEESTLSLGRFPVDSSGRLDARFTIPEDYGGVHDVIALIDGQRFAQGGIEVTQSFEMTPASGPVGTPIELRVKGLGWRTMESTWVVNWDNNLLGFVSAAGSKGSAVARFRAAGPTGTHIVKLLTGYQGQGYLNHEQSPIPHLPRPQFTFHTTPGRAAVPAVRRALSAVRDAQPGGAGREREAGAHADAGAVGTKTMLRGEGFPVDPRCSSCGRPTSAVA